MWLIMVTGSWLYLSGRFLRPTADLSDYYFRNRLFIWPVNWVPFQYPIRRFVARSLEISKPLYFPGTSAARPMCLSKFKAMVKLMPHEILPFSIYIPYWWIAECEICLCTLGILRLFGAAFWKTMTEGFHIFQTTKSARLLPSYPRELLYRFAL